MDASAIVPELKRQGIIDDGGLETIAKTTEENLHLCFLRTCDEDALMKVCEIVIKRDNPTMKALGEGMKSMLKGKCCVQVFIHVHCMLSGYLTRH